MQLRKIGILAALALATTVIANEALDTAAVEQVVLVEEARNLQTQYTTCFSCTFNSYSWTGTACGTSGTYKTPLDCYRAG